MHRRQFLRFSAGVVAPWAARPSRALFAQTGRASAPDPVVVVGAGLAGLRAAALLREAGRPVVVLEARAAPGGRVLTLRAPFDEGLFGEAGAVRIAPSHRRVWTLALEHDLQLVPFISTNGSALVTAADTTVRSPEAVDALAPVLGLRPDEVGLSQGALLQRYTRDLRADLSDLSPGAEAYARWRNLDQMSWPAWLRSRGASQGAVTLMTLGGDSRDLSALYVLRQFSLLRNTDQYFKIHGGMDQLPRSMAASLGDAVRYGAVVTGVEQRADRVRLDYVSGVDVETLHASRVIFAIPFSTLRRILVRPALSAGKARAIRDLRYFPATRLLLQTRERFWHDADLNASARSDAPAEMWACAYDLPGGRGLLGVTVGGEIGRALAGTSPSEAVRFGADLVAKTFPEMPAQFEKGAVHRWAVNEFSRGAFSVFRPGEMSVTMPGIFRPEGRLHFAGEHTSPWMGWMEGALESGERVASEVLEDEVDRRNLLR